MSVKQITVGQDSFLDIVANLVGVLIILVVVVGAQARTAWDKTEQTPVNLNSEIEAARHKLEAANDHVKKLEADNRLLEQNIDQQVSATQELANQRHQMLVQNQIVQQQLDEKREQRQAKLSAAEQETIEAIEEQKRLERTLAEVRESIAAVSTVSQPDSKTIEHYPNPIAKTVFADEVHFQLSAGRLSHVPMDSLVNRMKSEWKVKAEKLKQAQRTVETVGPIGNFRLQYELSRETVQHPTEFGNVERKVIRFEGFTLRPTISGRGESIEEALLSNSEFQQVLSRFAPGKTTVSVWIYPDSFAEYNQLKKWLYDQGYQIAVWPLDEGRFISGGPNGFRTSAQ